MSAKAIRLLITALVWTGGAGVWYSEWPLLLYVVGVLLGIVYSKAEEVEAEEASTTTRVVPPGEAQLKKDMAASKAAGRAERGES